MPILLLWALKIAGGVVLAAIGMGAIRFAVDVFQKSGEPGTTTIDAVLDTIIFPVALIAGIIILIMGIFLAAMPLK